MILDIIESSALLLSLCWLQSVIQRFWGGRQRTAEIASGLLFGSICIIGMISPAAVVDGLILDSRSAILSMAALFGGPVVALISGVLAGVYRLTLGGGGPLGGLANILVPIIFGLAYRYAVRRGKVGIGLRQLLIFSLLLHLPLAIFLVVQLVLHAPPGRFGELLLTTGLPLLLMAPLATALLGLLLQDIERRRGTEYELKQNAARLRAIAGAIPDLLMVIDEDGRYLEIISRDEHLLYAPSTEVLGRSLHEVLSTSEAENFLALIRRALVSDSVEVIEYKMNTMGGLRIFEGRAQRLETPFSGKRAVLFLARDISERVTAEQERRIAAIAFESLQGVVITDAHSRILRVNQAFTQITGYGAVEVIGEHTRILGSGRHTAEFYQTMWNSINERGVWEGEVWNRRKNGEVFPEWLIISAVRDGHGLVSHYVATLTDISERKAAEDQIKNLAFYDSLTGLPNRRLLVDRLQQALATSARSGRFAALMFLDLDNFKNINDLYGHQSGDLLLQQAAERLGMAVRASDTVARLGGDEFVVMLEDLVGQSDEAATQAEQVGMKILTALAKPYLINGVLQRSSASVGVVLFNDDVYGADELMKRADMSMYQAKTAGKNTVRFYDPLMQEAVSSRLRLEEDIRRGLAAGEFILHLQPQFHAEQGLIGAEALARWQHPRHGLQSPAVFIEVAERAGLIAELDFQILQQACKLLVRWAGQAPQASLRLAVNLSARLLYRADFVQRLLQLLDETGANPRLLKLELTETLLLDDLPEAVARMQALKARGIRFSIDDFGTGYSSMAYLQKLPLDQLKIDQSFVRALPEDASSLAIIRAICALAESLDLQVIAEGVESASQHELLLANGCRYFQGYLFGRPMPLEQFEQLPG